MARHLLPLALLCILLATAAPTRAEEPPSLDDALAAFVAATDPAERLELALRVTRLAPDAAAVAEALPRAWRWSDDVPKGEVATWTRDTADGVSHTVYAYVPAAYTPERAWPVFVWLHGGVSRDEDGGGEGGARMFADEAEKRGFLVLSPSTQNGAHWWSPNGADLVRGSLRDLMRRWRVDADRVTVAGLSDGASGGFHLLAHDPYPYASFLAFVGNPLVTRIFGGPTWSTNLPSRPVYAISGGQDRLYPSERMRPHMEAMREAGCDLTWIDEPEAGHDLSYLESRWDEAHGFWINHPREPLPRRAAWTTSRPEGEGRFAWVEIRALDSEAPAAEGVATPVELPLPDMTPRPRLGIRIDVEFPGPGLLIEAVEEGTPAAEAGFQEGDVLLEAGGVEFPDASEILRLREYLNGLEEDGVFHVERDGERVEIRARPQVLERDRPQRPEGLGYDVAPGTVVAEVLEGNVIVARTAGVGAIRLHLAAPLVDFERDLVVRVNGTERFRGAPPQDVAYLLAQVAANGPGAPVYRGFLDLDVAGD